MNTSSVALRDYFLGLQQSLLTACQAIEGENGSRFRIDSWEKPASEVLTGHGRTAIIEGGRVFERGGIAFSQVAGNTLPPAATAKRPELVGPGPCGRSSAKSIFSSICTAKNATKEPRRHDEHDGNS